MGKRDKPTTSGLVYSTGKGKMCPRCGWPADRCACSTKSPTPPAGGPIRVARETKGRKGKGVTVVTGLPLPPEALADLAKELKKSCGSGGTVRGGTIEIQGDHRDTIVAALQERGYPAKRSGG